MGKALIEDSSIIYSHLGIIYYVGVYQGWLVLSSES